MKNKGTLIKVIGLIILLAILIYLIDFKSLFGTLKHADILSLGFAAMLIFPLYLFKSIRLKLILSNEKIFYSLKNMLLIFFSSNFLGFITPGRIGEFAKCLYIKTDKNIAISRSFPSVFFDRIFDLLFLAFVGFGGLFYFDLFGEFSKVYYLCLIMFFALSVLILNKNFVQKILEIKFINQNKKIKEVLKLYYYGLQNFGSIKKISVYMFLTSIAYVFLFLQCLLIARSLGINLGIIDISFIMAITNIMTFLPISFSGIGTRDLTLVFLFSRLGLSNEIGMAFSILVFFIFNVLGGLIGLVCWLYKPIKLSDLFGEKFNWFNKKEITEDYK